jgi:hypothetical protein
LLFRGQVIVKGRDSTSKGETEVYAIACITNSATILFGIVPVTGIFTATGMQTICIIPELKNVTSTGLNNIVFVNILIFYLDIFNSGSIPEYL